MKHCCLYQFDQPVAHTNLLKISRKLYHSELHILTNVILFQFNENMQFRQYLQWGRQIA